MKKNIIGFLKSLWERLHRKRQPVSIAIEAANSQITLTLVTRG